MTTELTGFRSYVFSELREFVLQYTDTLYSESLL